MAQSRNAFTVNSDICKAAAGMEQLAHHGQLYFNLHTTGQSYYGDIRGQLYLDK